MIWNFLQLSDIEKQEFIAKTDTKMVYFPFNVQIGMLWQKYTR